MAFSGPDHQVTRAVRIPPHTTATSTASVTLAASQRRRVMVWVQMSLWVDCAASPATSGAPQNMLISRGAARVRFTMSKNEPSPANTCGPRLSHESACRHLLPAELPDQGSKIIGNDVCTSRSSRSVTRVVVGNRGMPPPNSPPITSTFQLAPSCDTLRRRTFITALGSQHVVRNRASKRERCHIAIFDLHMTFCHTVRLMHTLRVTAGCLFTYPVEPLGHRADWVRVVGHDYGSVYFAERVDPFCKNNGFFCVSVQRAG